MLKKIRRNIYIRFLDKFGIINRYTIACNYLQGEGIEIGAMNYPVPMKKGVKVKYYDRISREESHKIFPDINIKDLVKVDILGDGEKLDNIDSLSYDFVIANHFIEHCQNPILTLQNMMRVLRPGGYIYMAIPDKRYTLDIHRSITPLQHFIKDYEEGPEWSEDDHYHEFVKYTYHGKGKTDAEINEFIKQLKARNFSIHYHVWDHEAMLDMFRMIKNKFNFKYEIVFSMAALKKDEFESIFVLKKYQ